ncbi:nitronate monooxygenase [Micromonospora sp. NPDC005710]|uniref:nitronate monooxygenase n=1 Tax=Micromonospora sp. NPDC005710 TaxID=3157051 RepID=UPI0033D7E2D2
MASARVAALAAVLALGAQGAWLGTRFLASTEAFTHQVYRQSLVAATAEDTVHTQCFDGGWPDAAHRALRNSTLRRWELAGPPQAPGRPDEGDVVAIDSEGQAHYRYEDLMPLPGMTGDLADMAMYAGQSVELVRDVRQAGRLIHELTAQTVNVIEQMQRTTRSADEAR